MANRAVQLATRARGEYVKPEFPAGPFMIISPTGRDDGLFYAKDLRQSDLPGKPWAFAGLGGSPKVFRVKKQKGNELHCEDGVFTIVAVPRERLVAR